MNNKIRILNNLCKAVSIIGWVIVIYGLFWLPYYFGAEDSKSSNEFSSLLFIFNGISTVCFDFFFVGLATVIVAGFVRYGIVKESKPSLMLRCSDKIFYFFAVLGIAWGILQCAVFTNTLGDTLASFLYKQPAVLPTIGKAIVLILLGQIIKRLLPVIQEYKTLV